MAEQTAEIAYQDLLEAAQELNALVASLDRIGSSHARDDRATLAEALLAFVIDWDVARRIARVRTLVSRPLLARPTTEAGMSSLEEELNALPHWRPERRHPPARQ